MSTKLVRLFSFLFVLALIIIGSRSSSAQVAGGAAVAVSVQSRIVAPIDESVRSTIKGSVHPMAKPQFDVGPVDPGTVFNRMILVLGASPEQEYQARTLLDSQQTKGSPDYHHWLTPEEFGAKFGPSPQDLQQVTGWLQQHGFSVASVAKSGRWIEFSGTSAQVETAFQTQMRQYVVNGENHVANAAEVSIPAALAPVIKGVLSLHNFYGKPMLVRSPRTATVTGIGGTPHITFSDGSHGIVPGDFAAIYDLNKLYTTAINGTGETIAIVAASNISLTDVSAFRSLFGLSNNPPNIILNGPDPGIDFVLGIGAEATLDTEWSGAVAPDATIDVVVSGGTLTTDPVSLGAAYIINQNLADVMNLSFGNCEAVIGAAANLFWDEAWQQAAAQGISAFVSTGDTGAAGCDPNAPSNLPAQGGVGINGFGSTPFNTAVGGTEFNETVNGGSPSTFWAPTNSPTTLASAFGYIPEKVWNESCSPTQAGSPCSQIGQFLLFAGGGGVSAVYATPSYQTLGVTGLNTLNNFTLPGSSSHPRGIPDVSLTAAAINDPYVFCFSVPGTADCQTSGTPPVTTFNNLAGGTSFSSPSFAGIMALVDQKLTSRQGLANYVLYPLASKENFSTCNSSSRTNPNVGTTCVFNDTTVGNNGVPGNDITNDPTAGALGFPTATGYDLASGLGSVDAFNLVTAWGNTTFQGSQTTLSSPAGASINITHGTSVQFTVNVQKAGGGAGPTGNVAVITNQAAPQAGTFAVGAGVLASGSFTGSFNDLPGGSYNVTANYPGDGTFAGSVSNAIAATVAPEASSVSERSLVLNLTNGILTNSNTVAYGDANNILAVDAQTIGASGLFPSSGNVTFSINSSPITPIAIDNSGIGEYIDCIFPNTTCLAPGTYTFIATYGGDGLSYKASAASGTISVTITKGNPTPVVVAPASQPSGVAFTLQAQIQTGLGTIVPTGTVQFFDSGAALGSPVTLSNGTASMQATLNTGGNHNLTAQYSGDATYNAATSAPTVVNVTTPFNLTSTAASQIIAAGGTATFPLSLNGVGGFAGQVNFNCTGAPGGSTCTVSPNPANLSAGTPSVALTVTVTNTANAHLTSPFPWKQLPFAFAGVLGIAMVSLRRKPRRRLLLLMMAVFLLGSAISCGGGGSTPRPPTIATLTVTGTNNGLSSSITLNLTITH